MSAGWRNAATANSCLEVCSTQMLGRASDRRLYITLGVLSIAACLPLLAWGDPRAWSLLRNTLALAAGACALALPLGTVLAFLLLRTDLVGRKLLLLVFGALLLVPLYLQAAGWEAGFGRQGWFSFAHGSAAAPILDGWRAAIWIHGLAAVPWAMLIVGLGLSLIEPGEEDAALLDGSLAAVLWRVTLPRAFPSIVVAAVWILVVTGTDMTVTDLYQVRTFAEEIYIDVPFMGRINSLEPLRPTALTQVCFVGCLTVLALVMTSRLAPPEHIPSYSARRAYRLGHAGWPALAVVALALVLLIGVPVGNLIYKAGLTVEQVGAERVRQWSVGAFAEIMFDTPWRFAEEYGASLNISTLAASAAVLIAAPLAWLARRGTWRALPALLTSAFCLAVPGPMIGLSVIWLLNRESSRLLTDLYDYTIFAPWLAMLIKCLPITIFISWYALRTVSEDVVEAAASEGATWFVRFWRIGVLQHPLSLAAAWLAAAVVASGDLAASILVMPPGVSTIPVRVFGLLHSGVDDQVAGICLTTLGGFVVLGCSLLTLFRIRDRRSQK